MKFITFHLTDKTEVTVEESRAKHILESSEQLCPVRENGQWTGVMINKAFIVRTSRNTDEERQYAEKHTPQIEAPPVVATEATETLKEGIRQILKN